MRRTRRALAIRLPVVTALLLGGLLAAGCESAEPEPVRPVQPAWHRLTLPSPAGEPGRLMLRDLVHCSDRWYLVGAVAGPDGATRPAAWTSVDGQEWSSLTFLAESYYGRQNVVYSAGCRDGRLAAIGAKTGGAHAYPRTSSWWQRPDGVLVEVAARFELFGGPTAVNVGRLVGGAPGWLIVGNRSAGAAAWVSPDAAEFELLEGAPELASDDRGDTWAFDAVAGPTVAPAATGAAATGGTATGAAAGDGTATGAAGWLMVGGLRAPGRIDRDPLVWTSPDGRTWRRVPVPATREYEELQRVVLVGATPVAVGLRGRILGSWRGGEGGSGGWTAGGEFGAIGGTGVVPGVSGLTVAGERVLTAVSDGIGYEIWTSSDLGDSWRPVAAPAPMPAGPDRDAGLLAAGDRLVLFIDPGADDGDAGADSGDAESGSGLWWSESGL